MTTKRAILFAGQGAQKVGMGSDLAAYSPTIAALYQQADQILGYPISTLSFQGPQETLTQTIHCQPALYIHGYALHLLLKEHLPHLIISAYAGLSLGEYTAHAAAGTFTFAQGLRLVQQRAQLMQQACHATQGSMAALIGADQTTAQLIAQKAQLDIANYNAPGQIVLSGPTPHIQSLPTIASPFGIKKIIPLNVAGAYHSRLMQSAQDLLAPHIQAAPIHTPTTPVWANTTAQPVNTPAEIRHTLTHQITAPVLWEQTIRNLIHTGVQEFIELGPDATLAGLCKRINPSIPCHSISNAQQLHTFIQSLQP
jgi:[acyl-carrier-protein] S-malonyltransferase